MITLFMFLIKIFATLKNVDHLQNREENINHLLGQVFFFINSTKKIKTGNFIMYFCYIRMTNLFLSEI